MAGTISQRIKVLEERIEKERRSQRIALLIMWLAVVFVASFMIAIGQ